MKVVKSTIFRLFDKFKKSFTLFKEDDQYSIMEIDHLQNKVTKSLDLKGQTENEASQKFYSEVKDFIKFLDLIKDQKNLVEVANMV